MLRWTSNRFADLAKLAKSKPNALNYMAPSLSKVAFMQEFNKTNGTDIVRVPFKGGGDAVNSMLTGTTQIAIFGIGNLVSFIRAGKIVGLAIDGDTRSPLAPDIPTFKEVGYTKHIAATFFGIFAPAGTPKPIVDKLYKAIAAIGAKPDFQQKFLFSRGLDAGVQSAGPIRQGAGRRPRRGPRRGERVGSLSKCEVARRPGADACFFGAMSRGGNKIFATLSYLKPSREICRPTGLDRFDLAHSFNAASRTTGGARVG